MVRGTLKIQASCLGIESLQGRKGRGPSGGKEGEIQMCRGRGEFPKAVLGFLVLYCIKLHDLILLSGELLVFTVMFSYICGILK